MNIRPRSMLRDDQQFISKIIQDEKVKLIVAPMGRGKTAATLDGIYELITSFEVSHALVIAPKLVAEETWPEEIKAWEHLANLDVGVCIGDKEARKAAIDKQAEITFISRDNIVWLWKYLRGEVHWFFDTVIIDESSMFKAGKKRTTRARVKVKAGERWNVIDQETGELLSDTEFPDEKAAKAWIERQEEIDEMLDIIASGRVPHFNGNILKTKTRKGGRATRFGALSSVRHKIDRVYELTGTPSPNGTQDLWGQIYLLDKGQRLGEDRERFMRRYFDVNPYSRKVKPFDWTEEEIMSKISDVMVSLPPLDLVRPPVYSNRTITLPSPAMTEYRKFERTLYSEEHDVEAISRGVLTNKLLQFANGSMYRENGTIAAIHDEKLKALDELIEEANGDSMLIFYGFKFDLDQIRQRHPDAVVLNETEGAVKRWNEGKISKLLAHPASCAHGLNMQYGGHIATWFGLTWSLELYQQANARLPRPGQTEQVSIYHIIAKDTVDEDVLRVLKSKGATQDAITEAVRARLTT